MDRDERINAIALILLVVLLAGREGFVASLPWLHRHPLLFASHIVVLLPVVGFVIFGIARLAKVLYKDTTPLREANRPWMYEFLFAAGALALFASIAAGGVNWFFGGSFQKHMASAVSPFITIGLMIGAGLVFVIESLVGRLRSRVGAKRKDDD